MSTQPTPVDSLERGQGKPSFPGTVARLSRRSYTPLLAGSGLITAGLLFYSQTYAFAWDEGFHLLAAQLIAHGKRPYLDFLFAQTPLNAYWNAALMLVFGESWRTAHVAAALATSGAVILAADYVFRWFPVPSWRRTAALATLVLTGLNVAVFEYGPISQAYGLCLFLIVLAFRFAVQAVEFRRPVLAALAGASSGAAAAASLLTAPVAPVLLVWILTQNRAGSRRSKLIAFAGGIVIGFAPVLWFFAQSPRAVIFDIFEYHLYFRQINWDHWITHDLEVMTSWIDCSHALILSALAAAGLIFIRNSDWERRRRSEMNLCAWLSVALIAWLMTAHPTFPRYFLFVTPFAAIVGAAGLYSCIRLTRLRHRPAVPVILLSGVMVLGLVRSLYEDRVDYSWTGLSELAAKVEAVTPPRVALYADEIVYFLARRTPPPGMEWSSSHKIESPPEPAAKLHLLTRTDLGRQIRAGAFGTLETCEESDIKRFGLTSLYREKAEAGGCTVFWGLKSGPQTLRE